MIYLPMKHRQDAAEQQQHLITHFAITWNPKHCSCSVGRIPLGGKKGNPTFSVLRCSHLLFMFFCCLPNKMTAQVPNERINCKCRIVISDQQCPSVHLLSQQHLCEINLWIIRQKVPPASPPQQQQQTHKSFDQQWTYNHVI